MAILTPQDKINAVIATVQKEVPGFGWCWKNFKWYHRAIGWCFEKIGNPGYMTSYWTTFNKTVGRPSEAQLGVEYEYSVFAHEGQHSLDAKSLTFPLFALIYGFPQILALLAVPLAVLLVIVTHSWLGLLGLFVLALAAPLPSPGRVWAELRGYRVSMSCDYWAYGYPEDDPQSYIDEYCGIFLSPSYYFMGWLGKGYIKKRLQFYLDELKAGRGYETKYLSDVRDLCLSFAKPE